MVKFIIMELLKLQNLTKKYDDKIVLNDISQTFHRGRSIAFVGHNGCGKSTLLKMIAKLTAPTSGKVIHAAPLLFHYVPEKFPPTPLTAKEYLLRMGAVSGMGREEAKRSVEALGCDFFLDELLDTPMRVLSKGSLQKVGVIQALMKKPDVLLLDEPLSGHDAKSQKIFIEKVNHMQSEDVTVFMACHEQKLVEAIAEDVYLLKDGIMTSYEPRSQKIYSVILENAAHLNPVDSMIKYGRYYKLKMAEEICDEILPGLLAQGWKIRGMEWEGK